ncbi:MAG TPA: TetR/AcrR family transcriptional regulator [Myxococcota bacterium]|nr:TetR/AcrR family transcriptional regulator [Myxococcota bacterium]
MPKVVDADEQRGLIRGAARAVFARRGVVGTGLAQVAAQAGVSRTGLYHYYPDKAALVRDLARELLEEEERLFQAALDAPGSVAERIERLADGVVERFAAWASFGRPLLEIWARDTRRMRPVLRRLRAALAALIADGQRRGEIARTLPPGETAALLVGLIDGLMLQVFIDPEGVPPSRAIRDSLAETLGRILQPRSAK